MPFHLHFLQLGIELGKTGGIGQQLGIVPREINSLIREMTLVVVVLTGKDGIEQISLDIVIGPFILVDHSLKLPFTVFLLVDANLMGR